MTIAALRKIQDEADHHPGPAAPRLAAPSAWPTATVKPAPTPAAEESKPLPVGRLLAWGEQHPDSEVQDQAARARVLLGALKQRHAADQELAAITSEAEQLEKRLAEVRAWAAANGHQVSPVGRIPKPVVDAWRTATGNTTA